MYICGLDIKKILGNFPPLSWLRISTIYYCSYHLDYWIQIHHVSLRRQISISIVSYIFPYHFPIYWIFSLTPRETTNGELDSSCIHFQQRTQRLWPDWILLSVQVLHIKLIGPSVIPECLTPWWWWPSFQLHQP